MTLTDLVSICHGCPNVQWRASGTPCKLSGRYFVEHCEAGKCPADYFNHPPPARESDWSTLFKWAPTADLDQIDEWLDDFEQNITDDRRRKQFNRLRAEYPPDGKSHALLCWSVWRWRDVVNERLKQEQLSYEEAVKVWGW